MSIVFYDFQPRYSQYLSKPTNMRYQLLTGLLLSVCCIQLSPAQITNFPYQENFETSHGFTLSGTNSSWAVGNLSGTGFYSAQDGVAALGTNLTTAYNNNELSYATSPVFDFSGFAEDPLLSFYLKFRTESCCDLLYVEVTTNGGSTWQKVGNAISGTAEWAQNWYNKIFGVSSWAGIMPVWEYTQHELTGVAGQSAVQFRFVMSSDGSESEEGVLIDGVEVKAKPAVDADFTEPTLTRAATEFGLGNSEIITFSRTNRGTSPLSSVPYGYEITNPQGVKTTGSGTSFGTTAYGASATSSFSANLSEEGAYEVKIYGQLANDENRGNDTLTTFITHRGVNTGGLPLVQGFESLGSNTISLDQPQQVGPLAEVFYHTNMAYGRLDNTSVAASMGNNAVCLVTGGEGDQYVELTIDLAAYSASTDAVTLSLDLYNSVYDDFFKNEVWVRGSAANEDAFISLFDEQSDLTHSWTNLGINLSETLQTAGQDYSGFTQIRIKQQGSSSSYDEVFCVDNLQLTSLGSDIALLSLAGVSDEVNATTKDFTLTASNTGSDTVAEVPITLQLVSATGTTTQVTDTLVGPLNPGDTATLDFLSVALSSTNAYTVNVWHSLMDDLPANDSILNESFTNILRVSSLPYEEGFEGDYTVIEEDYFNSSWEVGAPTGQVIAAAYSGTQAMVTQLSGALVAAEESELYTPFFDFSGLTTDPEISFALQYDLPNDDFQLLQWEISLDSGNNWSVLDNGWYDVEDSWIGSSQGWQQYQGPLTGAAGQPHVQLRLYFSSLINSGEEGVALDDLRIFDATAAVSADAGVTEIITPAMPFTASNYPVQVVVANADATATINSLEINWSANGVAQTPIDVPVSLAPGASDTLTLGTYDFQSGREVIFSVVVSGVNGMTDTNPTNDTLSSSGVRASFEGDFLLGASESAYFRSFDDALSAMQAATVNGPTTFLMESGTYLPTIFSEIPGTSPSHRVTFTSLSGTADDVIISPQGGSSLLEISGADYVTMKKLNFQGILLSIESDSRGVDLLHNSFFSTATAYDIVEYYLAADDSLVRVIGNTFEGGGTALDISARSKSSARVEVDSNTFINSQSSGFFSYQINEVVVKNSTFYLLDGGSSGIVLYNTHHFQIEDNRINIAMGEPLARGISIQYSGNDEGISSLITNNEIIVEGDTTVFSRQNYASGLQIFNTQNLEVFHNSLVISGIDNDEVVNFINASQVTFKNNLVVNDNEGILITTRSSSDLVLDHNAYFTTAGTYFNIESNPFTLDNSYSLTEWQSATGHDQNSLFLDPQFQSDSVLIPQASELFRTGTFIPSVVYDILGTPRSTTAPTIGAYEVAGEVSPVAFTLNLPLDTCYLPEVYADGSAVGTLQGPERVG
ncbi:MAG TPA: hypothetical protein DCE41_11760, partial [Cytophagales bacterium]|nr:hypothetical protein [Cytophagales bacterium]